MILARKCWFPCHLVRTVSSGKETLYAVLGVKSSATQGEIKTAYYELSKIYHPDINKGSADSLAKFRQVSDAYEVLGNVSSRRLYDRGLVVGGSGTTLRDDVETDPTVKFYKQWDKRHQVPTPLDRDTVYDFDAWTKAHYSAAKDRKYAARMKHEFRRDRNLGLEQRNQMNRFIFGFCLICFGVVSVIELCFGETNDKDRVSKVKVEK